MIRNWIDALGDWFTRSNDPWRDSSYHPGPKRPPFVEQSESRAPPFRLSGSDRDLLVTPLARFQIRANILSRRAYSDDHAAPLSPIDLFVSWGDESHKMEMLSVEIEQRDRRCRLVQRRVTGAREAELMRYCANIHVIPAAGEIARPLTLLSAGESAELAGELVEVRGRLREVSEFHWRSSLSREDVGEGACELLWLTRLVYRSRLWVAGDALR